MQFATEPFAHQRESYEKTRDLASHAVFWEMGCGKTKLALDIAAWQYLQGRIDTVLVIAPKGVHRNWVTDEIPLHLSPDVGDCRSVWYSSTKAGTKRHQQELTEALEHDGLVIIAMNYDAMITKPGRALAEKVMGRKVMLVLDESPRIKNPTAKRTKAILKLAPLAVTRRILTGTPITNGPFDAFSQIQFLDPLFWVKHHFRSFFAFKNHFGVFQTQNLQDGRRFNMCVSYRNVDTLYSMLEPISSRVVKEDVLDLPAKLYSKVYVEMTTEQRQLYRQISEEAIAFLTTGEMVTANLVIVEMLRLQQIVNGFVKTENSDEPVAVGSTNPRLNALVDVLDSHDSQAIVWARFQYDIDRIAERLKSEGVSCVTYDGRTSDGDRAEAIEKFRSGAARVFVANPAAAGEGLTLTEANLVVYYSNAFKLSDRLQSEDRAHRIGQDKPVLYVDLVCPETVDEKIVEALRRKLDVASLITGDNFKEWI